MTLGGYQFTNVALSDFVPGSNLVMVEETLAESHFLLQMLRQQAVTEGVVLACGADAQELHGITPGDRVVYEPWMGGRWAFLDPTQADGQRRVLLMFMQHVVLRVPAEA